MRERFERALLMVMGPPDVGDLTAPVVHTDAGPVAVCGQCGERRDRHEVVRSPGLTYSRCPDPAPGRGQPHG